MNLRRRELAAAVGAALVVVVMLGREAQAERLWTERPAELRASPGDDSQIVKRVSKGRSLEVVKRLGTWVQVEYEGRTGWIRRTALSTEPVSGGSSDAGDKDDKKKSDDDADDEGSTKAAAGGAKKSADKKKADRRKSRKSRRGSSKDSSDDEDEEELASSRKKKGSDDDEDKPRRPRSSWAARGRLPGGPLKVEIQALSAQAFSEPDGSGSVVFTVAEGDQVRVIARGENRWLLVENGKKRTGWIPAVAVRDHGLLLDARKDGSKARKDDDEGDEEVAARDAEEEEVSESKSKKKKSAALDDESEELDEESSDEESDDRPSSSSDDTDATLGSSFEDEDIGSAKKPWTASASLRGGFAAVGVDRAPGGVAAEETSYNGPIAGFSGEFMYKVKPKIGVLADLVYDFTYPLGGLTHTANGAEQADISAQVHRVAATVGGSYGKDAMFIVRAGFSYSVLQISDINNPANLPRESTSGPLAGLAFAYKFAASGLGTRVGVDALLFGSRSQTEGKSDGADLDSMLGLVGSAMVDYPLGKSLTVLGGYRFGYTTATWAGASERNGAMATEQKDQSHEISLGVGLRL
jgi:uncharacterized protein YgiM (DUF1202 family)